jgi:5'-nucleotidase
VSRILVTNDDGIEAVGLKALARALASEHEVVVVAPERERSASGHSITLHRPLHAFPRRLGDRIRAWAVTGTPADCVKLGVQGLMSEPPDLVIAGVNHGSNLGRDIFYSGTVSAAIEAHFLGLAAMAVSQEGAFEADLIRTAATVAAWLGTGLHPTKDVLLNVNFPPWERMPDGPVAQASALGRRDYVNQFERRTDPRGHDYFWLAGQVLDSEEADDTDVGAVRRGLVAVTPLRLDVTAWDVLPALRAQLTHIPPSHP